MTTTTDNALQQADPSIEVTRDIVVAYVARNPVSLTDLPKLIADVHGAVRGLRGASAAAPAEAEELRPAVPIKKSITPDAIICLEDGKKFKSLKRHLSTVYQLTPDEYRARWGLPADYPMVAPNYSAQRSQLAKDIGLGRGQRVN